MRRTKKDQTPKREAPLQFRPGPDLDRLIGVFARRHSLQANEACRRLVALAVLDMDGRFYDVVAQMAEVLGGADAFTRACVYVHAALVGARTATGSALQHDPERARFIQQTVRHYLGQQGRQLRGSLAFIEEQPREEQEEGGWSSEQEQPQQQRIGN